MPTIFDPSKHSPHVCFQDRRFEPDYNRSDHKEGTIWECPTCGSCWRWATEYYDLRPSWTKISRRKADRLIRKAQKKRERSLNGRKDLNDG